MVSEELSELLEFAAADFEPTQAEIADALATVRSLAGRSVTPLDAPLSPELRYGETARRAPRRRGLAMIAAAAALALAVFAFQALLPTDQGGPAPVLAVGITADGRNAFTIRAGEEPVLTPLPAGAQAATVSPDGSTIAYHDFATGSSADTDIYALRLGESQPTLISGGDGVDRLPSWSPDGSTIAFLRLRGVSTDPRGDLVCDRCTSDLMVTRVGSGHVAQVTSGPRLNPSAPTWSRDGRQIAFVTQDGDAWRVVAVDLAGKITLDHPCRGLCGSPSWSPDGSAIAYVESEFAASPKRSIAVVSLSGGPARALTDGSVFYTDVAWSEDGRALAAVGTDQAGEHGIYIVDPSGGTERKIADVPGWDWSVSWTQDDQVIFQGQTPEGPAIFSVSPDGGAPVRLI